MENILDQLYMNMYEPDRLSQENRQVLWAEYLPMCQKVTEAFGLDFTDRFTLLKARLEEENSRSAFRQGVRLGLRLALEAAPRP